MDFDGVKDKLKEAIDRAGGQIALANASSVSQGQISDYCTGRRAIENMTLGTFFKLFPLASVNYFGEPENKMGESASMEIQLITLFRSLAPQEQAKLLLITGAHFRETILAHKD